MTATDQPEEYAVPRTIDVPSDELRHPVVSRRRIVVATVLALVLFVCTGCGLAGRQATPDPARENLDQRRDAVFALARCVRDQGIHDYPDPQVDADGGVMIHESESDAAPEALAAARRACQHIVDQAPQPPGAGTPQEDGGTGVGWEQITPGGDCRCADDSGYSFFVRKANLHKVVLLLGGGGACWSAKTCAPGGGNDYQTTVRPPLTGGVFDAGGARNPVADYSFVFAPYCTGDLHLGNATTQYAPGLTVQHKGYVNGTAALDHLAATFPDAVDVVVIGESAGSLAAPVYAGLAADRLPAARITAISDSSGAYPDLPEITDIVDHAWATGTTIPDWSKNAGRWSFPGLFVQSARQHPNTVFARYDHAYDENQESHLALAGAPTNDLLSLIDATAAQIEAAGVDLHSYVAPGDEHVVLVDESFYTEAVEGVALIDWITSLIGGRPVDDVHCVECRTAR